MREDRRRVRPRRAWLAVVDVVLAAVAVAVGVTAWQRGVHPLGSIHGAVLTRDVGGWLAAAVGLVTLAGLLVLDALRNCLLVAHVERGDPDRHGEPG